MAYASEHSFVEPTMPGALRSAWNGLKTWYAATLVRDELMKLSDRDLADIGVVRGNIDEVAMQAAKKW